MTPENADEEAINHWRRSAHCRIDWQYTPSEAQQLMTVLRLNHKQASMAAAIQDLMKQAYAVEARLIGVEDFAPLKRSAAQIAASNTEFWGICTEGELLGLTELDELASGQVHIDALVVRPSHFRRGLATRLLGWIFAAHQTRAISVATAAANHPALELYRRQGFGSPQSWSTADGISMLTLSKLAVPPQQNG